MAPANSNTALPTFAFIYLKSCAIAIYRIGESIYESASTATTKKHTKSNSVIFGKNREIGFFPFKWQNICSFVGTKDPCNL